MSCSYSIGPVQFDAKQGLVKDREGLRTTLRPKTAEILAYLAQRSGQLVSREELIEAVWPGIHVTENGLSQCVKEIRRAFGADETLLRTLPRRGYVLEAVGGKSAVASGEDETESISYVHDITVPAVAILPFARDADHPLVGRLSDVLLDALVGALATFREPLVISANSTRALAPDIRHPAKLGRRLGAHYIVAGTLRRFGDDFRLSTELTEARSSLVVWQHDYALGPAALHEPADRLAAVIAHALVPRLREHELRRRTGRPFELDAYYSLLEGRALMMRLDPVVFDNAGVILQKAVEAQPGFAAAHAALASWYSLRIGQRWSPDPASDSEALLSGARHAVELDGANARALALLGHSRAILYRDYEAAEELLGRAVDAAPNDAEARIWATPTLAYIGQARKAIDNAEHAIRLSPEDPLLFRYEHFLSIAHYQCGNFDEAAKWGLRSMRRQAGYTSNLALTLAALGALGQRTRALPVLQHLLRHVPNATSRALSQRFAARDEECRNRYGDHLTAAGLAQ